MSPGSRSPALVALRAVLPGYRRCALAAILAVLTLVAAVGYARSRPTTVGGRWSQLRPPAAAAAAAAVPPPAGAARWVAPGPAADRSGPGSSGAAAGAAVPPPAAPPPAVPPPAAVPPVTDTGPPSRLRVPAIGVDSPLESLTLDAGGILAAPRSFAHPGWYADGTRPGEVGPAVIAGHVDARAGPAVFFRLGELRTGDLVQVRRGERWIDFRVVVTGRYAKDRFPTAEVYGATPDAQLRLITCGGEFDRRRGSYRDNVVVYAVAA